MGAQAIPLLRSYLIDGIRPSGRVMGTWQHGYLGIWRIAKANI
jgi:hypothetical protein